MEIDTKQKVEAMRFQKIVCSHLKYHNVVCVCVCVCVTNMNGDRYKAKGRGNEVSKNCMQSS